MGSDETMSGIVFAIVGMPGSGKSEVARLFAGKGVVVVRFGDVTEEEIRNRGLEQTPATEKAVREDIRSREGMDAYARRNVPRIDAALSRGHVAADGLYSWPEFLYLRETYGDRLRLIAVTASPNVRYRRLAKRPVRPHSPETAWQRDLAEIEGIQKAGPIAMADHTLLNEGSLEALKEAFERLWGELGGSD
ncbi:MAG: AAA family ATPase [Planctomycetota bacterium]|jgi:dephospho-CoA kinase